MAAEQPAAPDDEGYGGVATAAAERMTFFTDAVVAIAITLLAIELPVPDGETGAELWRSVQENSFEYTAFLISFAVIADHWSVHHKVFRWVRRADQPVVALNFLWLLMVVITPFLTRVLTEHEVDFPRFAAYALAQAVQTCTLAVIVAVVVGRGWLAPDAPATLTHRGWAHSLAVGAGFLISIPLFLLVGSWAFAVWLLVPALAGRVLPRAGVTSAR